ncbi:MAG: preprotein translocase subunit SecG [bacterium]|nr:preprotein translocase subunit SecG [bacterium]
MDAILPIVQIILAVALVIAILLQQTGAGLGGAFGGTDTGGGFNTRRGFEKILFRATIILAFLFVFSALFAFFMQ